jgi:hypothetical protein
VHGASLHTLADALLEQVAGCIETLQTVSMVQFQDLVERAFCHLGHFLVELPFVEIFFLPLKGALFEHLFQ